MFYLFILLFKLILCIVLLSIIAFVLGLLFIPLGYIGKKSNRKRKMVLAFLSPNVAIGIFFFTAIIVSLIFSLFQGIGLGISDTVTMPLKNNYTLTYIDIPDQAGIYKGDGHEGIFYPVKEVQLMGDSVIGSCHGTYFILNTKTDEKQDSLTFKQLTEKVHRKPIKLMTIEDYETKSHQVENIVTITLGSILSILGLIALWKIGLSDNWKRFLSMLLHRQQTNNQ